jgi:penicillin-binding protein 1C
VQLLELAAAYATLGRGGSHLAPRFFESDPVPIPRRVLPADVTRQILDILADPRERAATFGRDGPLEFDLPIAVKTGTSKGNRDNWTVGVSPELTVAVWVGNFDGSPMLRSSGASGAGPLFHEVMEAALRRGPGQASQAPAGALGSGAGREPVWVCAASGLLAGPACPHRLALDVAPANAPHELCSWHERRCATGSGEGHGSSCPLVEVLPERYAAWALDSGRWLASVRRPASELAELALPGARSTAPTSPRVVFPRAGQRFVFDARVSPSQHELLLRAEAEARATLRFEVNGVLVCEARVPFECSWPLRRGRHELIVRAEAGEASRVPFSVD